METVLVTGCDGYLGSRLVRGLVGAGHHVVGWGRRTKPTVPPGCSYYSGDLLSDVAVKRFQNSLGKCINVIYHLADVTNRQTMAENPLETCRNSVTGMRRIVSVFQSSTAERLIYVSTGKVYGADSANEKRFGRDKPRSISPQSPAGVLGTSRWLAETFLRSVPYSSDKAWSIARVFNVYGPEQPDDYLVPTLIRKFRERDNGSILLHGSLDAERDFIHVQDAVNMLISTGMRKDCQHMDFDVGSGAPVSVFQVAKTVGALLGYANAQIGLADDVQQWRAGEPDVEVACLWNTWGTTDILDLASGLNNVLDTMEL